MRATNAVPHLLLPLLKTLTLHSVLLLAVGASHALTLGNVRGTVLVGRTLNVTVPVQLDASEQASSVCAEVEVAYGDNVLSGGRVRRGWQVPEATKEGLLRVETTLVVDEPVVSLNVSAGCVRKTVRKYVLLADAPVESAKDATLVLPIASATAPGARATSRPSMSKDGGSGGTDGNPDRQVTEPTSPSATLSQPSRQVPRTSGAAKPAPKLSANSANTAKAPATTRGPAAAVMSEKLALATAGDTAPRVPANKPLKPVLEPASDSKRDGNPDSKGRLKLDAVPQSANLKSTLELVTSPAENDQAREDAKALWRSLNAQPEDILRDNKRLQTLEAQVKAMQVTSAKNQQAQESLKSQLSQAETERYVNPLVGGLSALLLCTLGAAGYAVLRMRRKGAGSEKDWWRQQSSEPSILSDLAPVGSPSPVSVRGADAKSGRDTKSGRDSKQGRASRAVDVDLSADDSKMDSLKSNIAATARPSSRRPSFGDSVLARSGFFHSSMGTRSVNVEELFDVQQQAEFFVSLGQHDQAIDLLQQHIYGATNTSGLAYLDLLQLYHQHNRREEFDQLRLEFNRLFNAHVPLFENFTTQQNRGISRYTEAINRIQKHWNTPEILDVLQDLIFKNSEAGPTEAFDLKAYRELMLLFSIAKDLSESSPGVTAMGHDAFNVQPELPKSTSPFPEIFRAPQNGESNALSEPPRGTFSQPLASLDDLDMGGPATHLVADVESPKLLPPLDLDVDLFALESTMAPLTSSPFTHDDAGLDFSLSLPGESMAGSSASIPPVSVFADKDFDISNLLDSGQLAKPLKPLHPAPVPTRKDVL